MKSKAYRALDVNEIEVASVVKGREGQDAHAGVDMGKEVAMCMVRWGNGDFERPWRIRNPFDVKQLAGRLAELGHGRRLVVAMEPTGTYGDPLRQALANVRVEVHRVSPKMASDYAEVFDGVPSQHDGKDAAIIAELSALGRSWPWPMQPASVVDDEMAYWVGAMDRQRRQMMLWVGSLEGLLSRHWPEATRIVKLRSGTLLRCLSRYGGPRGLASAPDGLERVQGWGGRYLALAKAQALVASAVTTSGVATGPWQEKHLRRCAEEIRRCQAEIREASRQLRRLAANHAVIQAMGQVVGVPTACVLWTEIGDPREYHCGSAYRKAMGLNLAERSSGQWQGELKISKRGSSRARRWLYLAALRWVKKEPVRGWFARQKANRRGQGKAAAVGVMRKLALALFQVAGRGVAFDAMQLYRSVTRLTL